MQMVEEGVNDIDMMGLSSREMEIIDLVASIDKENNINLDLNQAENNN